ncbi:hypothetical protein GCM10010249_25210 [Streptomyces roseolilacinus]|uniref:Uncharacterized protein n=1 Tax=Streptomyces roseolilacinus TaxID=66904 RepID=A0A918AZA4_9ACTN|nr:hypothetical protein GCM10010249_25210 [Streptomyces roseolilacinus]
MKGNGGRKGDNPGQLGPGKGRKARIGRRHFGYFLSGPGAFSYAPGTGGGGDFPNSIALNHAE